MEVSSTSEGPVLIGRDPEVASFDQILDGRSSEFSLPAVVVVSGERGMGKTSLLRVFELRAAQAGWNTAFINLQKLGVTEDTNIEMLCGEVRKKLGFEEDKAYVEASSAVEGRHPYAPSVAPSSAVPALSFAEELASRSRRASFLILIDQFERSQPLAPWLSDRFLPDLKQQSSLRAIVALACPPEDAILLRESASNVFELGKLPEHSLRQRLEEIGRDLEPPLIPAELEGYSRDPDMRPEMVGSLLRLLAMTRRTIPSPASTSPAQN